MGSSYTILQDDINALKRGYDFLMKNQSQYDSDFVKQVSLLYASTIPREPKYTCDMSSSTERYIDVGKDQYKSYQKLRELLHNPKPKVREPTQMEQVLQLASALDS